MSTREIIKLRQMIWTEYQAGINKEQAVMNICATLRSNHVSELTVNEWYTRFRLGETSLFDSGTEQSLIPRAIQTLPNGVKVLIFKR
jgi:hypothetical protein